MIYCRRFAEVDAHIRNLGFVFIEQIDGTLLYRRGKEVFTIHAPNVTGGIPEMLVDDAFTRAGLSIPDGDLFWCD